MSDQPLTDRYQTLRQHYAGFSEQLPLTSAHDFLSAGLVWGKVQGNLTPRILLIALQPGHWEYSSETRLDELAIELLASLDGDWPAYAELRDDANGRCFALFGESGTHSIDEIPGPELILESHRLPDDPTFKWSMEVYGRLMSQLDAFHEQVYQTVKDHVSDKNDIIEEVAKMLFLESFLCHHQGPLLFDYQGQQLDFRQVFSAAWVSKHGSEAVKQIQTAFDQLKSHPDYVTTADDGSDAPIFPATAHLRLSQPENYHTLLQALQDLGPVTDNSGTVIKANGSLADVTADVLGRVFDVFLRANFESKGGLGVYLTPAPVKQAMLDIAFHDILGDNAAIQELVAGEFRFCDPTCGSYGMGAIALGHVRRLIRELGGLSSGERETLLRDTIQHGFIGADSAPRMVMLARVSMALQDALGVRIFYTANSLTSPALLPESQSLICTNPPFGTPKFKSDKHGKSSKQQYEQKMERILGGDRDAQGALLSGDNGQPPWPGYRSDLEDSSGGKKKPCFTLRATSGGLALGSKPDAKGNWKPVKGASIDPAVLFIDRCLQLLKPGGRLLIVLPDGVLCNSGDRYVREYIMGKKDPLSGEFVGGKAIVKAVISLPADTFKLSGTGAKTSILYLQKRHSRDDGSGRFLPEPQTDVFMAVAETLGYVVKNNVEDYSSGVPNDLDRIVGAYRRGE